MTELGFKKTQKEIRLPGLINMEKPLEQLKKKKSDIKKKNIKTLKGGKKKMDLTREPRTSGRTKP